MGYSQKTAQPVAGILGPNAYKAYRVEIDYQHSTVYFEKHQEIEFNDMDMAGLTLRPEPDGNYSIIGIAEEHETPSLDGIMPGDTLVKVDGLIVKNSTMGTVVDALRGKPGDVHRLLIEHNGRQFEVVGVVKRFL
jgi:C-terminal processing protease CtpA/Prc